MIPYSTEATLSRPKVFEIIGRDEAHAQGKRLYYTGEPCRRGHTAERYVSTGACRECLTRRYIAPPLQQNTLHDLSLIHI